MLASVLSLSGQDWLPMDRGLNCPELAAGTGVVREFLVDELNNNLYAIGLLRFNGYCEEIHIIPRWNGTQWEQVGDPLGYNGFTAAFFEDNLYAYGQMNNDPSNWFHKFDNGSWIELEDQPNSTIPVMKVFGDSIFMGGSFEFLGNDTTHLVGMYHDGQFHGLTRPYLDATGIAYAIAHYQGHLYLGGNFSLFPDDGVPQTFSNLARVVNGEIEPFGDQFLNGGSTSVIWDLEVYQDELYIAGGFYTIAGYSGDNIMKWNGEEFLPVGEGASHNVKDLHVYNDELYALGFFSNIDDEPCKYIAKWNGYDWTCLNQTELDNPGQVPFLRAITVYNDQLIVGGSFTTVNGDSLNSVAIIDGAVGLSEVETSGSSLFELFPNPTEGELQIKGAFELGGDYEVLVYDGLGRLVFNAGESPTEDRITLQLPNALSQGLYHLRIVEEGTVITQQSFAKD